MKLIKEAINNSTEKEVNKDQTNTIRKVIASCKGLAAMSLQNMQLEKFNNLLKSLSFRFHKQDLGLKPLAHIIRKELSDL